MKKIGLKAFQKEYIEEFYKIIQLFDKNNFNYSLAFGTMLGAVRDNNIIKWDCDIDVFVDNQDVLKLVNNEIQLPEGFYLKTFLDGKEPFGITRIYIKKLFRGSIDNGIMNAYFDLFHYFGAKKTDILPKIGRKIKKLTTVYFYKTSKYISKNIFKRFIGLLIKPFISITAINNRCLSLTKKISPGKDCIITLWYTRIVNPMPFSESFIKKRFGEIECNVFDNYHDNLVGIYGSDYMIPKDYGVSDGMDFFIIE